MIVEKTTTNTVIKMMTEKVAGEEDGRAKGRRGVSLAGNRKE